MKMLVKMRARHLRTPIFLPLFLPLFSVHFRRFPFDAVTSVQQGCCMGHVTQWAVWGALEGDPALLARRLRSGKVSREELALAADLIEGPRRLRQGQPSQITNEHIAEVVFYIEVFRPERLRKQFIPDVAKEFGVSQSHIYNVLTEFEGRVELPFTTKLIERLVSTKPSPFVEEIVVECAVKSV